MNLSKLGAAAAAATLGLSAASLSATTPGPVQRFGNVYARSVCGHDTAHAEARCFAKVLTDASGNIREGLNPALTRNAVPSGFGPTDLRDAYNITSTGSSQYTIAIVDAFGYPNAEADLAKYRSQYGLPSCTTSNGCFKKVGQTGGNPPSRVDVGWQQETALDLDMASAMCPSCHILLVESTNDYLNNLAAAANYAAAHANAVSNSYGGSEGGTTSYESAYNHSDVAITVSSGDYGYGVQFPASSPHVIAVGGTSLRKSSGAWTETAWSGAGSGCSSVYGILQNSGGFKVQDSAVTGCPNRAIADVSAIADPNTGVAVYGPTSRTRSGWMIFGGTSVAAPLIAGIYGATNDTSGYMSAKLYGSSSSAFRDVTSGSNGTCPTTQWCKARAGWDGPTGLGTPQTGSAF
jgi:hypothetical protein